MLFTISGEIMTDSIPKEKIDKIVALYQKHENDKLPSLGEIARTVNISPATVRDYLRRLKLREVGSDPSMPPGGPIYAPEKPSDYRRVQANLTDDWQQNEAEQCFRSDKRLPLPPHKSPVNLADLLGFGLTQTKSRTLG